MSAVEGEWEKSRHYEALLPPVQLVSQFPMGSKPCTSAQVIRFGADYLGTVLR